MMRNQLIACFALLIATVASGCAANGAKFTCSMAETSDAFRQRNAAIFVTLGGEAQKKKLTFLADVAQQKLESALTDVQMTTVGLQSAPELAKTVDWERGFLNPEERAAAVEILRSDLMVLVKVAEYKRGHEKRAKQPRVETLFLNANVRAFDLRTGQLILTGDVVFEGQVAGDTDALKKAHRTFEVMASGVVAKLRPLTEET